jgi:hypothetical protein
MIKKVAISQMLLALGILFSGCITQATVIVGLSESLEEYYSLYPSLEVDIAALSDDEVNSLKSEGVENYFSPNSSIRTNIAPFTIFFSEEHTAPVRFWAHGKAWKAWRKKKPTNLAIVVSLPHDSAAPPSDPRMLVIPLKKESMAPVYYVEIDPKKITRIATKPADPKPKDVSEDTPTRPPAKSIEQDLITEGILYAF